MKILKYVLIWLIGLGSAIGTHYAPTGIGECNGEMVKHCASMLEVFFCISAIGCLVLILGMIISDGIES